MRLRLCLGLLAALGCKPRVDAASATATDDSSDFIASTRAFVHEIGFCYGLDAVAKEAGERNLTTCAAARGAPMPTAAKGDFANSLTVAPRISDHLQVNILYFVPRAKPVDATAARFPDRIEGLATDQFAVLTDPATDRSIITFKSAGDGTLRTRAGTVVPVGGYLQFTYVDGRMDDRFARRNPGSRPMPEVRNLAPIDLALSANMREDRIGGLPAELIAKAAQPAVYIPLRPAAWSKPKPFAAATVLEAMRRIRRLFWTRPFYLETDRTVELVDPRGVGRAITDVKAFYAGEGGLDVSTPGWRNHYAWVSEPGDMRAATLAVMSERQSDLQAHFFASTSHARHACWMALNSYPLDALQPERFPEESYRAIALKVCTGAIAPKTVVRNSNGRLIASLVPLFLSLYNELWVDPKTGLFDDPPAAFLDDRPKFDADGGVDSTQLPASRWALAERAKGRVNVFDYVMLPQPYAFDWLQQQAVLNAFYGDLKGFDKGADPKAPFSPDDPLDCVKYRPERGMDPRDGTHCRVDKIFTRAMLLPEGD